MKDLFIMRHADAVDAKTGQKDFDRPLSALGKTRAQAVGVYLKEHVLDVGAALVSPACRTMQTYQAMREVNEYLPEPDYEAEIYNASFPTLKSLIAHWANAKTNLLLLGHNPAVHELAIDLCSAHAKLNNFRPASFCVIHFKDDQNWQCGELTHFYCP